MSSDVGHVLKADMKRIFISFFLYAEYIGLKYNGSHVL